MCNGQAPWGWDAAGCAQGHPSLLQGCPSSLPPVTFAYRLHRFHVFGLFVAAPLSASPLVHCPGSVKGIWW